MTEIFEILVYLLPSAGIIGSVIAAFLNKALNKAREDADKYRTERIKAELLRLECDQKTMELLTAITRFSASKCDLNVVLEAEQEYRRAFENMNRHHRVISVNYRNI